VRSDLVHRKPIAPFFRASSARGFGADRNLAHFRLGRYKPPEHFKFM
jgi:hypothetical protein